MAGRGPTVASIAPRPIAIANLQIKVAETQQSSATFFCFFAGTGEEQTARGAFSDALVGDSRGIRLIKIFFSQHEHKFRLWIRGYAKSAAWCTYLDGAQGRSGRGSVRPDRGKDLRAAHPILRSTALFLALLKGMDDAVKLNQEQCPRIQIQPHDSGYLGLRLGVVHP